MAKRVVCRSCKAFFDEGASCPICKKNSFTTSFQGRVQFINAEKSVIAKKMGVEKDGEYAIKIR
jgi:RNA polymerase subunit RPABC4/transcription elongation factor Spt4